MTYRLMKLHGFCAEKGPAVTTKGVRRKIDGLLLEHIINKDGEKRAVSGFIVKAGPSELR